MTLKMRLNGHSLAFEHEDKLYFPEDGITKGMLLDYYRIVGSTMARYTKGRPLTVQRFPEGIHGTAFFQKNISAHYPSWIDTVVIPRHHVEGENEYPVANNAATIVYLAGQGSIPFHRWLSTVDALNYPNVVVFDLDPSENVPIDVPYLKEVAFEFKHALEHLGLTPWVMTTGSRGFHVCVPIKPEYTFDEVRTWAHTIAEFMISRDPERLTLESRKDKRGNKVLLDIMRNGFSATAVVPYSVRPKLHAPVATPITWDELAHRNMRSDYFTIADIEQRLHNQGDVWKSMHRSAKSLKKWI